MQNNKKIVGYTAGVYDMFHVGHLNLLRNAKQHCDYLIVGVNSDEATYGYKNKHPVVSEDERKAIVSAIKYVDETVHIDDTDKIHAYEKFKPDVIIVGDDHKNEPRWQEVDKYLRERGSKVIFLPYTEHISSTFLRDQYIQQVRDSNGDAIMKREFRQYLSKNLLILSALLSSILQPTISIPLSFFLKSTLAA